LISRTSIEAYYDLRNEGRIGPMQRHVLDLIRRHPGRTDRELAELAGYTDPNALRPRRTELCEDGHIVPAGKRRCSITGRTALTWRVRGDNPQLELFG